MVLFSLISSKLKQQHSHHSFSESLMENSIKDAEAIIHGCISPELLESSSFCCISSLFSTPNREEAKKFINAVNNLHSVMTSLITKNPSSMKLVKAENLMRMSMNHLSNEFNRILKSNRRYLEPESLSVRSSNSDIIMSDLKIIADCMTSSGYGKECFIIYKKIRKSIIIEAMVKLGFENLSLSQSQIQKLEWEIIEKKIKKWLQDVRKAIILFCGERILSDHVFSSSVIREGSFAEITIRCVLEIFFFIENFTKLRKSPEKIFFTLDVYESIVDLLPKINDVFSYKSTSTVRLKIDLILTNLGDVAISMIDDFETEISKETSKSVISGGGIHQLTRYVMNFIVFLADYSHTLTDIIGHENFAKRIERLIFILLCKIDAKSRQYDDVALSYLSLINNINYVVVKVRTSNLNDVLSDDWLEKHALKVKKYVADFEKLVWGEMMTSFLVVEENLSECIRLFSDRFERAYKRQIGWVVPDPKLRDEIRRSVAKILIPKYSELYQRYRVGLIDDVGFTPEDVGDYLSALYFGSRGSGSHLSIHPSDSSFYHA